MDSKCKGKIMATEPTMLAGSTEVPSWIAPPSKVPTKIVSSIMYIKGIKKKTLNWVVFIRISFGIFLCKPIPMDQNQPKKTAIYMIIITGKNFIRSKISSGLGSALMAIFENKVVMKYIWNKMGSPIIRKKSCQCFARRNLKIILFVFRNCENALRQNTTFLIKLIYRKSPFLSKYIKQVFQFSRMVYFEMGFFFALHEKIRC